MDEQPGLAKPFGNEIALRRPPLCPEIALWLIDGQVDLEAECRGLHEGESPPYWAFCWGSGQALARWLLDHPDEVRGRRVVDFGSGSGVAGIAAAMAGAREVVAVDVDPAARAAVLAEGADLDHAGWVEAMDSAARLGLEGRYGRFGMREMATRALGAAVHAVGRGMPCAGAGGAARHLEGLASRLSLDLG